MLLPLLPSGFTLLMKTRRASSPLLRPSPRQLSFPHLSSPSRLIASSLLLCVLLSPYSHRSLSAPTPLQPPLLSPLLVFASPPLLRLITSLPRFFSTVYFCLRLPFYHSSFPILYFYLSFPLSPLVMHSLYSSNLCYTYPDYLLFHYSLATFFIALPNKSST